MSDLEGLTNAMRQVDPSAIETELDNDWRGNNAKALASGGQAAARSSVLTLVIYSNDDDQARRALESVDALTGQHPSRSVIVAPLDPSQSNKALEAYIRTRAEGFSGAISYGEEIVLRASPSASAHLAGAILPLILSGLPAFLWWQGTPPWRAALFEATIDGFDRVLVDTADMGLSLREIVALDDVISRKRASCAFSDFGYTRLNPWRELVARFFDSSDMQPYLHGLDRVAIEYAAGEIAQETSASQAYLFAGWLASRLGWTVMGAGRTQAAGGAHEHTLRDGTGRKIMLEINPRYGLPLKSWTDLAREGMDGLAVGPGALMSIYLRAQHGTDLATFSVARESQDLRIASTRSQAPGLVTPSQTIQLPDLGEAIALSSELERAGHDTVFEESIALSAQLLGASARRS
jgi:glucose-6-phosphate dehydrogenase assembly protein OpcA